MARLAFKDKGNLLRTKTNSVLLKDPVNIVQLTLSIFVINNQLVLSYSTKVAVCSEIQTEHVNAPFEQNVEF
jgi:hypothetical protein